MGGDFGSVTGGFGVVAERQFAVVLCDLRWGGVAGEFEDLVIVGDHYNTTAEGYRSSYFIDVFEYIEGRY